MRAIVTHGHRFFTGEDGQVLTENGHTSGYEFFRRYLDVFEEVTVVGRLNGTTTRLGTPVTGPGVTFAALPYYHGPYQYLRIARRLKKALNDLCRKEIGSTVFIARSPENISTVLINCLSRRAHPYAMEVISDPADVFRSGSVQHPARPFFKYLFPRALRGQCAHAAAVSYVTQYTLQRRYPPAPSAYTTHYSSITLEDDAFRVRPRNFVIGSRPSKLVCVGSLSQMYKGQDVLIKAVARCVSNGLQLNLTFVGDGIFRSRLEELADQCGLRERVSFAGMMPSGGRVREILDQSDLFVLPSRGEGLPRAMIEAMAWALPCIGTDVSGIPELLEQENLAVAGDAESLANRIMDVLRDPARMTRMSRRNLSCSRRYSSRLLRERRIEFYRNAQIATEEHLNHIILR